MKRYIASIAAIGLAASAACLAFAKTDSPIAPGSKLSTVPEPTYAVPDKFVAEPVASASKSDGPDGAVAMVIVEAMSSDATLKGSKITVQPDEGKITLSGTAVTKAQAKRAFEIASAKVGEANVTNAIQYGWS